MESGDELDPVDQEKLSEELLMSNYALDTDDEYLEEKTDQY